MINLIVNDKKIENINAVLFDKDGTFLDDHIYWGKLAECRINEIISYFKLSSDLFVPLCLAIGHEPDTCRLIKNGPIGTLSRNEVINFMVQELKKYNTNTNFDEISQLFAKVHKEFMNNMNKYVKFVDFSEEFIRALKKNGIKLAVVTSDTYEHTIETLKILNLADCFDCVIGKNNCAKDKKTGEPAVLALQKLGVTKEETVVIGDAQMDYEMAENTDLRCILTATGQTDIEVLKTYSNCVVENLSEVKIQKCF